jgi:hypothetical protein
MLSAGFFVHSHFTLKRRGNQLHANAGYKVALIETKIKMRYLGIRSRTCSLRHRVDFISFDTIGNDEFWDIKRLFDVYFGAVFVVTRTNSIYIQKRVINIY